MDNKMKPIRVMIHIGRKVPKGFEEISGGIHLGKGIWMLPMRPIKPKRKYHSVTAMVNHLLGRKFKKMWKEREK